MHHLPRFIAALLCLVPVVTFAQPRSDLPPVVELIPPTAQIKADRPRLLLRPKATPLAISLDQLKAIPRDAEFETMLAQLKKQKDAACLAMVYLLTGDKASADAAVAKLATYKCPKKTDSFTYYMDLREAALAYDWLHDYPGFNMAAQAVVRKDYNELAAIAQKAAGDHIFHNYTWMAAGGATLWALATAGDDADADKMLDAMRTRLNNDMYHGMAYLAGQFGESPGYWTLYDLSPCALTVLAAQSAFESDLVKTIREKQGNWLNRQLDNVVFATMPNMRFVTWGDIQSGGDGGVAHEVIGVTDGLAWAMDSSNGAWLSQSVAKKRGPARFYGFHNIFYFLYTRNRKAAAKDPPLSYVAGTVDSPSGGTVVMRSGWADGDTAVAFRCTNFFGGHNHFDQGSFAIYRNGWLACDPDLYKDVGGPQQSTKVHNTLLIGGKGQRTLRAQWFKDVPDYVRNLTGGNKLATGQLLFFQDAAAPEAARVAGQFAQAYAPDTVKSCVRQVVFVRPGLVAVIDELVAPEGKELGTVQWGLQLPGAPTVAENAVTASNAKSFIRCWSADKSVTPTTQPSIQKTQRATFEYKAGKEITLLHLIQIGDGAPPAMDRPECVVAGGNANFKWNGKWYLVIYNTSQSRFGLVVK